jgi:arginine/lysine/ornithine decarboxylase
MNARLAADEPRRIRETAGRVQAMKDRLRGCGWETAGDEPMKLTLRTKGFGWTGTALAEELSRKGIIPEFADPDYLVLMPSSETGEEDLRRLREALEGIPRREPVAERPPELKRLERAMSVREAMLSPAEVIPAEQAAGRILADPCVGCPPAVPPAVAGERLDEAAAAVFRYYGIRECAVVRR